MNNFYEDYNRYCFDAIESETIFNNFRHFTDCGIVDSCWDTLGRDCLLLLQELNPEVITKLITSDEICNPKKTYYPEIGLKLNATTIRYGLTAVNILKLFDIRDMNILEIGIGYGGQCKVLHDLAKPKSYTLVDYPGVLELSKKWLGKFEIKPILRDRDDIKYMNYDLIISNFAFSEMDKEWQAFYLEHLIDYIPRGYMVCNIISQEYMKGAINKKTGQILPEEPISGDGNFIYIWNDAK
jgi:hypothetical protein